MRQIIIGIYKIINPTGKIYIGQSVDVLDRFRRYKSPSKSQKALYSSFEKYGIENHIFEIVEECDEKLLNERERYWQDHYDVIGHNGLNCRLTKTNDKSGRMSEETKTKMRLGRVGINLGRKASDETKLKMSLARLGLKRNQLSKDKMSKAKQINKINDPTSKIILDLNTGVYYYSIAEAAFYFDLKEQRLYNWMCGKTPKKLTNLILA